MRRRGVILFGSPRGAAGDDHESHHSRPITAPGEPEASAMLENVKPGQKITVSVTSRPHREDKVQTIERLMRQDISARRALARAQRTRRRETPTKTRGGRRWFIRQHPAKVVRVEPGASWEMTYIPHLADDFRSVEKHLEVKPA
jgi:hypothetical protein